MSVFEIVVMAVAAVFATIGFVQMAGPRFVRDAYEFWGYAQRVRFVTGVLDIGAAVLLATPALRGWGIALAAMLMFGSVIVLLNRRHYFYAIPATALMVALVPATMAVPQGPSIQFVSVRQITNTEPTTVASGEFERASVGQDGTVHTAASEQVVGTP
jgi:hypothetical protein